MRHGTGVARAFEGERHRRKVFLRERDEALLAVHLCGAASSTRVEASRFALERRLVEETSSHSTERRGATAVCPVPLAVPDTTSARSWPRRDRFGSSLAETNPFGLASTRVEETSSRSRQFAPERSGLDTLTSARARTRSWGCPRRSGGTRRGRASHFGSSRPPGSGLRPWRPGRAPGSGRAR